MDLVIPEKSDVITYAGDAMCTTEGNQCNANSNGLYNTILNSPGVTHALWLQQGRRNMPLKAG